MSQKIETTQEMDHSICSLDVIVTSLLSIIIGYFGEVLRAESPMEDLLEIFVVDRTETLIDS